MLFALIRVILVVVVLNDGLEFGIMILVLSGLYVYFVGDAT